MRLARLAPPCPGTLVRVTMAERSEQIVIIGDLTRSWHRFGPVIQAELQAQGLSGGVAPKLIPVHEDGMARLRGTVALVLQKHFGVTPEVTM